MGTITALLVLLLLREFWFLSDFFYSYCCLWLSVLLLLFIRFDLSAIDSFSTHSFPFSVLFMFPTQPRTFRNMFHQWAEILEIKLSCMMFECAGRNLLSVVFCKAIRFLCWWHLSGCSILKYHLKKPLNA